MKFTIFVANLATNGREIDDFAVKLTIFVANLAAYGRQFDDFGRKFDDFCRDFFSPGLKSARAGAPSTLHSNQHVNKTACLQVLGRTTWYFFACPSKIRVLTGGGSERVV